jgi:hypothetical protein
MMDLHMMDLFGLVVTIDHHDATRPGLLKDDQYIQDLSSLLGSFLVTQSSSFEPLPLIVS